MLCSEEKIVQKVWYRVYEEEGLWENEFVKKFGKKGKFRGKWRKKRKQNWGTIFYR